MINTDMAYSGKFKPKNPEKYKGDPTNIIYRSLWELKAFRYLDMKEEVNWWQSEEIIIWYYHPKRGRPARYFPDLVFEANTDDGKKTFMIEIKPEKEMLPPKPPKSGRKTKRFINESVTYAINQSKWEAARNFCADRGWHFQIWGETILGV